MLINTASLSVFNLKLNLNSLTIILPSSLTLVMRTTKISITHVLLNISFTLPIILHCTKWCNYTITDYAIANKCHIKPVKLSCLSDVSPVCIRRPQSVQEPKKGIVRMPRSVGYATSPRNGPPVVLSWRMYHSAAWCSWDNKRIDEVAAK